jgi:hypothetical protein
MKKLVRHPGMQTLQPTNVMAAQDAAVVVAAVSVAAAAVAVLVVVVPAAAGAGVKLRILKRSV